MAGVDEPEVPEVKIEDSPAFKKLKSQVEAQGTKIANLTSVVNEQSGKIDAVANDTTTINQNVKFHKS